MIVVKASNGHQIWTVVKPLPVILASFIHILLNQYSGDIQHVNVEPC